MNRSTPLIALGAVAIGALACLVIGASFDLILVVALFIPVFLAWLSLCGTLHCCERAIDAMLAERYATLRATFGAAVRQRGAGKATRHSEVQR